MNVCDAYNNQPCRRAYGNKVPCCRECAEFLGCQRHKCLNNPKVCRKLYTPEQAEKLRKARLMKYDLLRKIERSKNHD